nr:hypothetical protein [Planctomycetota bacterium]
MTPYPVWVGLGIALAALISARQTPLPGISPMARLRLALAATIGAILGAYLFELPADLLGWAAPIPGSDDPLPLGGRTVLG